MEINGFIFIAILIFILICLIKTFSKTSINKLTFQMEYTVEKYFIEFFETVINVNSLIFIVISLSITSGIYAILFVLSNSFPMDFQMGTDQSRIFFLGGLMLIITPLIATFREDILELKRISIESEYENDEFIFDDIPENGEKTRLNIDTINYCYAYTKYKEKTRNPELDVKTVANKTLIIDSKENKEFFNKKLIFTLKFKKTERISEDSKQEEIIPSLEIGICQLENYGTTFSHFKVLDWKNTDQYPDEIIKIQNNQDLKTLRPFIQLREDAIGEKCNLSDMENIMKVIDIMKKASEEEEI
jgi:hypothetical protein